MSHKGTRHVTVKWTRRVDLEFDVIPGNVRSLCESQMWNLLEYNKSDEYWGKSGQVCMIHGKRLKFYCKYCEMKSCGLLSILLYHYLYLFFVFLRTDEIYYDKKWHFFITKMVKWETFVKQSKCLQKDSIIGLSSIGITYTN